MHWETEICLEGRESASHWADGATRITTKPDFAYTRKSVESSWPGICPQSAFCTLCYAHARYT
ncbi:hypothetical protein RESH_00681 [Rhodopirellula europaea SH398]|uniref:Uncharacterized protein n=1 Tax=Rhodopirellula europaea SH398 TaxID=1263868 RepID=M5SLZ1_9BACT|nr:hypothetical protein RESH_00681 [Rhodopirellula europaea SH398]